MDDPKAADCYLLMLSLLCRPSEAASAGAKDIILMNGERVWRIPDTKNSRDFLVPLQGPIAEILLRRSLEVGGKGPLFWKYNADRDYPEQLKKANRNFRELSKLEDIRPHEQRGEPATRPLGLTGAVQIGVRNQRYRRRGLVTSAASYS
jgi:integrase